MFQLHIMSLKDMKNLGPVSAKKLQDSGIASEEDLRWLGAVEACDKICRDA